MDEQIIERVIRQLSSGFGYRFPNECFRCGRKFEPRMIGAIERAVRNGKTIIESIQVIRYDRDFNEFTNPGEANYYPNTQALALGPRDICCRMSIISPHVFPTGTIVSHSVDKKIVGTAVKTDADGLDFFDFMNEAERPEMIVDEDHGDIRLYIEDGIPGFEPPIEWEDL